MKTYTSKPSPAEIQAIQFTGKNLKKIRRYCPEAQVFDLKLNNGERFCTGKKKKKILIIKTNEYGKPGKDTIVQVGEYIVWQQNNTYAVISEFEMKNKYSLVKP